MGWFKKKSVCVHCNTNKTRREFEGESTCAECEINIKISREEVRSCPVDGTEMKKEQFKQIIIDRCPKCNGVWLDGGELQSIKETGDSEFATAIAIGMMVN